MTVRAKLDTFRNDSRFTTWVHRIAVNALLGQLRRRRWNLRSPETASDAVPDSLNEEGALAPERAVLQRELWTLVRQLIKIELDGKAFRPDGKSAATLNPAAFGLAGVNQHTWTGSWGTVTYWNAFVANLEMRGKGNFFDPRLSNKEQYPVAARANPGNVRASEDRITPKLAALHFYQLAIAVPKPPEGSFDRASADRRAGGRRRIRCALLHGRPSASSPRRRRGGGIPRGNSREARLRRLHQSGLRARSSRGWNEARLAHEQAVQLAPDHVDARYDFGGALAALDRPEDALREFRQVLRRAPMDADAH